MHRLLFLFLFYLSCAVQAAGASNLSRQPSLSRSETPSISPQGPPSRQGSVRQGGARQGPTSLGQGSRPSGGGPKKGPEVPPRAQRAKRITLPNDETYEGVAFVNRNKRTKVIEFKAPQREVPRKYQMTPHEAEAPPIPAEVSPESIDPHIREDLIDHSAERVAALTTDSRPKADNVANASLMEDRVGLLYNPTMGGDLLNNQIKALAEKDAKVAVAREESARRKALLGLEKSAEAEAATLFRDGEPFFMGWGDPSHGRTPRKGLSANWFMEADLLSDFSDEALASLFPAFGPLGRSEGSQGGKGAGQGTGNRAQRKFDELRDKYIFLRSDLQSWEPIQDLMVMEVMLEDLGRLESDEERRRLGGVEFYVRFHDTVEMVPNSPVPEPRLVRQYNIYNIEGRKPFSKVINVYDPPSQTSIYDDQVLIYSRGLNQNDPTVTKKSMFGGEALTVSKILNVFERKYLR